MLCSFSRACAKSRKKVRRGAAAAASWCQLSIVVSAWQDKANNEPVVRAIKRETEASMGQGKTHEVQIKKEKKVCIVSAAKHVSGAEVHIFEREGSDPGIDFKERRHGQIAFRVR